MPALATALGSVDDTDTVNSTGGWAACKLDLVYMIISDQLDFLIHLLLCVVFSTAVCFVVNCHSVHIHFLIDVFCY